MNRDGAAQPLKDNPLHWRAGPSNLWTNVNTAEALPGVMTPLAWTFWEDGIELAMRGAFYDMGVLAKDEVYLPTSAEGRYSVVFFGRYTANVEKLRQLGDRLPGTDGDAVEEQILGAIYSNETPEADYSRVPFTLAKLPALLYRIPKVVAANRAEQDEWWKRVTAAEATADPQGAPARLAEARRRFGAMMHPHISATMLCQAAFDQVAKLAEAAGHPGLETSLVTGYGDFEEAKTTADLWAVSRGRMELSEFVAEHGYHGPSEGTLHSRSWREDDTPLRKLVETYKTMPDDSDPGGVQSMRRAERLKAEATILDGLSRSGRVKANVIFRLAKRQVPLREVGKASFLQAIDAGRAAARSWGAQLAAESAIDHPEDVFYLTADEVESGETADLRDRIAERRATREEYLAIRMPSTWTGAPEAVAEPAEEEEEEVDEITALPVAPGVVEARARVVTDPDEGIDIEPGEVLVCNTTDPSWASYFLVASALVIDIGGAMSHGAIVARELGVPCVINTRIGTQALKTGDLLKVDGGAGTVTVLERAD